MINRILMMGAWALLLSGQGLAQDLGLNMSVENAKSLVVESCGHSWPRAHTSIDGDELVLKRLGPAPEARDGANFNSDYRLETRISLSELNYSQMVVEVRSGTERVHIGYDAATPAGRQARDRRIAETWGTAPAFGRITVECETSEPCVVSVFNQRFDCRQVFNSEKAPTRASDDWTHREECSLEVAEGEMFTYSTRYIYFDCYDPIEAIDALYILSTASKE